ncbi:MAG: polyprenyl synthetase family protein, partial [Luminiphilus sp.]|nr:polyprenyl synthetase family protein [Luminiphilus sp.]
MSNKNNPATEAGKIMDERLLDCEQFIEEAMAEHATAQCPPLLAQALNYAVFPGGARVRPQLCKAVAIANNSSDVGLANAAATAVE